MTPLGNLTSAFECLWETKVYLLRAVEGVDEPMQAKLKTALAEVASTRDRIEKLLIELQEKPSSASAPHPQ